MKAIYTTLIAICLTLVSVGQSIEIPLRFDKYYTYEEVNEALEKLHTAYKNITKLELVGKSEEGRKILALTINNPKTGKDLDKPGIYVDGNIHGNEIQAGEVCLYYANMVLTKYKSNPMIKELVDRTAMYIIPVVNPDGRWHFFNDGGTSSSNRTIRRPKDDDRDGLIDEDDVDDLDGDGNICRMRIKDPNGNYKTDPEDPRLMIQVKPGEKGEWTMLGSEGLDNDGDGRFNEDGPGYVDPNRNWPFDWQPTFIQGGAGDYPLSGVGLKAIAEFLTKKKNILMVWAFHNTGGMFLRGPSTRELVVPGADIQVYDLLGKNAEKMVPGYVYKPSYELYPTRGDFGEFTYHCMGAYTFIGELYQRRRSEQYRNPNAKVGEKKLSPSHERMKFNDHLAQGELYKDWKPFKHPQYGDIEIGGWVKFSSRLSHTFMLQDLVHRNASAVLFSAQHLPHIKMEIFDKKKIGKNLYKIRVRLENTKGISSMSEHSWQKKVYTPDMLKLSGAKVIASGLISDVRLDKVNYKEHKPEIQFLRIGSYGKLEYEFIVEGKGEVKLEYKSRKANNLSTQIIMR